MKFIVYSKPNCVWCIRAKELLNKYQQTFNEITVGKDITRDEFFEIVGPQVFTVPQIYFEDLRTKRPLKIGGYHELAEYLENTCGNYGQ